MLANLGFNSKSKGYILNTYVLHNLILSSFDHKTLATAVNNLRSHSSLFRVVKENCFYWYGTVVMFSTLVSRIKDPVRLFLFTFSPLSVLFGAIPLIVFQKKIGLMDNFL